jgi:hypothetical protein
MARRGAKRKLAHREKNGRAQRPPKATVEQIAEADREARLAETRMVRMQPHRKPFEKPDEQMLATALGRFVRYYRLRDEFYHGGLEYAKKINRIRAWYGAPRDPGEHQFGSSDSGGATLEMVRAWECRIAEIERSIERIGDRALPLVKAITLDDQYILRIGEHHLLVEGLRELAIAVGCYDPRDARQ